MKAVITVTCPECGGELEIDVSRQRVLSHKRKVGADDDKKDKSKLFDAALDRVRSKEKEGASAFDKAKASVAESEKKLDELFGELKKKVEEEKKKPDAGKDPRQLFWD